MGGGPAAESAGRPGLAGPGERRLSAGAAPPAHFSEPATGVCSGVFRPGAHPLTPGVDGKKPALLHRAIRSMEVGAGKAAPGNDPL